ncbi:hypothetical protein D8L93_08690 [Sodalis-like symbiont of Bactericera trigonica]|nr:hypothetical protein D8L93_08690 [Sodalis-like symbiont of Bactericera trigonica]
MYNPIIGAFLFMFLFPSLSQILKRRLIYRYLAAYLRKLHGNCAIASWGGEKGLTYQAQKVICAPRSADKLQQRRVGEVAERLKALPC